MYIRYTLIQARKSFKTLQTIKVGLIISDCLMRERHKSRWHMGCAM